VPEEDQQFVDQGLHSWMEVPLGDPLSPIGLLSLRSTTKNAYDADDLQLLERVSFHISPAFEIARFYAESQAEAAERTVLAEISRIITSSSDIDAVYGKVTEQIQELISFDRVIVAIIDWNRRLVTDRYVSGGPLEGGDIGTTHALNNSVLDGQIERPTPHVYIGSKFGLISPNYPTAEALEAAGLVSIVSIPLVWNDEIIGVLTLRSKTADAYDERDAESALKIANQISGSVASAELLSETRREREETAVLAEISRIITSTSDIEDVYQQVAEQIRTLIDSDRVIIETIDVSRNLITIRHVHGTDLSGRKVGSTIALRDTIVTDIIDRPRALPFSRIEIEKAATRFPDMEFLLKAGVKSLVVAPLVWRDEVIGTLLIRSLTEEHYGEAEALIATKIANQVAGAVAGAELLALTRRESEEQAALAEISRIITSTAEMQEVYDLTAELIRDLVPFDRIVISTIDLNRGLVADRYVGGVQIEGGRTGAILPLDSSLTSELIIQTQGQWFGRDEVEGFARRFPGEQARLQAGLQSIVTAPLIWDGEAIGMFLLRSRDESAYGDAEATVVMKIANQISGAVANAQLVNQRLRDANERAALSEIGRAVNSDIDLATVYATVGREVEHLVPFDRMSIVSIDRENDVVRREHIYGLEVEGAEVGTTLSLEPDLNYGLHDLSPTFGDYTPEILRDLLSSKIPKIPIRSYLRSPLTVGSERFGYLSLESVTPGALDDYDLPLLESIARVISPAIENAMLYEATQLEARERALLAEMGRVVSSSIDLNEVYERFVGLARELIPADRVVLSLINVGANKIVDTLVWGVDIPDYPAGSVSRLSDARGPKLIPGGVPVFWNEQEVKSEAER